MPWAVTNPMPTVVFPDTREGHEDWTKWEKTDVTRAWFCPSYSGEHRTGGQGSGSCRHKERNNYPRYNACERCVAGFIFEVADNFGERQSLSGM